MAQETVTIPKDEYIQLLRCKSEWLEQELAMPKPVILPLGKPHSWMNRAERAEILKRADSGHRSSEIARQFGRSPSTVSRCIKNRSDA